MIDIFKSIAMHNKLFNIIFIHIETQIIIHKIMLFLIQFKHNKNVDANSNW